MAKFSLTAAIAFTLLSGGIAAAREKAADAPKEKKVCKTVKTSGSRIASKKICKTEAEWAQAGSQEELDDAAGRLRGMTRGN